MSEEKNIPEEELTMGNLPAGSQGKHSDSYQKASEPAVEQTQPQTSNIKPQTEEMEVHHHGHVHHQKKWKEYLFQFLMLFLAITAWFCCRKSTGTLYRASAGKKICGPAV